MADTGLNVVLSLIGVFLYPSFLAIKILSERLFFDFNGFYSVFWDFANFYGVFINLGFRHSYECNGLFGWRE